MHFPRLRRRQLCSYFFSPFSSPMGILLRTSIRCATLYNIKYSPGGAFAKVVSPLSPFVYALLAVIFPRLMTFRKARRGQKKKRKKKTAPLFATYGGQFRTRSRPTGRKLRTLLRPRRILPYRLTPRCNSETFLLSTEREAVLRKRVPSWYETGQDTARRMVCLVLRIDRAPAETTPRDTNSRIPCRHP